MTDQELIAAWRQKDDEARALWKEILARELWLEAVGFSSKKQRDSFYHPPRTETAASASFYQGVRGVGRGVAPASKGKKPCKEALELAEDDFGGDFE